MNSLSSIQALLSHELRRARATRLPWWLLAATAMAMSLAFFQELNSLQEKPDVVRQAGVTALMVRSVFGLAAIWFLFVVPALTMRALAEETRSGTLRLFITAPLGALSVVLGKYLACLVTLILPLLICAVLPALLWLGTTVDWGIIVVATAHLALLLGIYAAIGLFCSSLVQQPSAAAMLATGLLLLLWLLYWPAEQNSALGPLLGYLSPAGHMEKGFRGTLTAQGLSSAGLLILVSLGATALRLRLKMNGQTGWLAVFRQPPSLAAWLAGLMMLALTIGLGFLPWSADFSAEGRIGLSADSLKLLTQLKQPVQVQIYAPSDPELRQDLGRILDRYRRHSTHLTVEFIHPDAAAEHLRTQGIRSPWAIEFRLTERSEFCDKTTEECVSGALWRLLMKQDGEIGFLTSHGERRIDDNSPTGLSRFAEQLTRAGYHPTSINLTETTALPENVRLLAIAGARSSMLPGEQAAVLDYARKGGALLWLLEPGSPLEPAELAEEIGLSLPGGIVLSPDWQLLGSPHPAVISISDYAGHPIASNLDQNTLFAFAQPLKITTRPDWQARTLARTLSRTWAENNGLTGEITFDAQAGDVAGPFTVAMTLTRRLDAKEQRFMVTGEANFLSNRYIDRAGNAALSVRIVDWLTHTTPTLNIPTPKLADAHLDLSRDTILWLMAGLLLILPGFALLPVALNRRRR